MGIREIPADKRDEIIAIAAKHGARNVHVFGSVALGDAGENSDVAPAGCLRPRARARILKEAVPL